MQQKHLFEYAVIRVVPRVEREEFLNIGVILYCAKLKFLQAKYLLDEPRLTAFSPTLNVEEITVHVCAFEHICLADKESGPIGKLDMASRFRWLTATRSTVLQTSKVHPGFCEEPNATLDSLFGQLVS